MLTYTKAPTVDPGDKITSTQYRLLARAFNGRLRSGVGDCAMRVAMLWFNLFRQFRNPDEGGYVFPSLGEFFDIYQLIEPEWSPGTTYPDTGPGEPEGANLGCPINQFVFGNPILTDEPDRLNTGVDITTDNSPGETTTVEDYWESGKRQRGAFDPNTGAQAAPAWDAAQTVFQFAFFFWSPMHKAWGGWQPIPLELTDDCGAGDPDDAGAGVPSWQYFFTALRMDVSTAGFNGTPGTNGDGFPTITYAGSCPCGSALYAAGHVAGIVTTMFEYVVYVATGTDCETIADRFPFSDWIIGPFTGGAQLVHTDGGMIARAVNAFATDFRGTPEQRNPDDFEIEKIGFDFQEFSTRQHYLAPNYGNSDGENITPVYPRAEWSGVSQIPQGTVGSTQYGSAHRYAPGFVLAGAFAKATNLYEPVSIAIMDGSKTLTTIKLKPDVDGNAQAMVWLKNAVTPDEMKIVLATTARFSGRGSLVVEVNELQAYKPNWWDYYLLARFGGSKGGIALLAAGVDGRGKDCDFAKSITDNYLANGCIVSPADQTIRDQGDWINDNPVYDTIRRMSKKSLRILRRQNLLSYEVSGGVSILRFKRFAFGMKNTRVDCFDGIAPPLDPVSSGDLIEGEGYIVRASADAINKIVYNGQQLLDGQQFIATANKKYETHGDAQVFVYDGIRHTALKKGETNEWVMFIQTKVYHDSADNLFKPEAYADYFPWCANAHFLSPTAPPQFRRWAAYTNNVALDPDTFMPRVNPPSVQVQMLAPEAPTGYNFSAGANVTFASPAFCASRPIYEAPFEIDSCIVEDSDNDIIKITFKQRFRAHPLAAGSVDKDPNAWAGGDIDVLRNVGGTGEDYRTPDNALREYVLTQVNQDFPATLKTGDYAAGASPGSLGDLRGAVYPHFFFVHLIPEPYEDFDDTAQDRDERCTVDAFQQMEVCLRAMCEGFVDGVTSLDLICKYFLSGVNVMYDYAFENLCFQAFQGRWIGAFSLADRDDAPQGFGPMPDTLLYADVFNRLALAVNLLDKARLDVPIEFQSQDVNYAGSEDVTLTDCSATSGCTTVGTCAAYGDGLGSAPASLISTGAWTPTVSIGASAGCSITGCPYQLTTGRIEQNYRVEIDPDFVNAVPQEIRDLLDLNGSGFFAVYDSLQTNNKREIVGSGLGDGCFPPGSTDFFFDTGDPTQKFRWVEDQHIAVSECRLVTSGTLAPPPLLVNDYQAGHSASAPGPAFCDSGPSSSASLTLVNENGAFLQVPLVEAE